MQYALEITPAYRRQFKKLPIPAQKDIRHKLGILCLDPFAGGLDIKKLQVRDGYRLRVGDYRVIYRLDNKRLIIIALDVGHRKEIY